MLGDRGNEQHIKYKTESNRIPRYVFNQSPTAAVADQRGIRPLVVTHIMTNMLYKDFLAPTVVIGK